MGSELQERLLRSLEYYDTVLHWIINNPEYSSFGNSLIEAQKNLWDIRQELEDIYG